MTTMRKLMITAGYEMPAEIEDQALAYLADPKSYPLKYSDLVGRLTRFGVPMAPVTQSATGWSPAYRIADKLLQRERKAGRISANGGRWHLERQA